MLKTVESLSITYGILRLLRCRYRVQLQHFRNERLYTTSLLAMWQIPVLCVTRAKWAVFSPHIRAMGRFLDVVI